MIKNNLFILVLAIVLPAITFAQEPKQFASISYPAPGNIEFDEGTIEIWLQSNYDTDTVFPGKSPKRFIPFDLLLKTDKGFHYWWGLVNGNLAFIGFTNPRQSYVWSGALQWKANEWHYLALTWSGRMRSVYVDGRARETGRNAPDPLQGPGRESSSANVRVEGWINGNLTGAQLLVGYPSSFITVDELRISTVAKTAEEIAQIAAQTTPPQREATTLLLDHFDGSPAECIAGYSGETGGKMSSENFKIVPGKFGKALQLWTE